MNCTIRLIGRLSLFLCLLGWVAGCQVYHDTAARYNAYFLAQEKMREVEQALFATPQDDYNNVLQVLMPIDTTAAQAQKTNLEYCIKMASRPIQFHKSSKWVDDCYIILGKARLYMGQFKEAINTFKYVNTESQDPDARHQALTWLMRCFIETGDYKSVEFIANYLSKEEAPVKNETVRQFYITLAHFYRIQNDYAPTAAYLEQALPLVKEREFMRRSLYIMAQIYQKLGDDTKAYDYYSQLLRKNPSYEMMFQAQLNASRAAQLSSPQATAQAEKNLQQLLKDEKNAEYKDKILYEMAMFELKRNNTDKAIKYLKQSAAFPQTSPVQKSYSYLALGNVYYEKKNDLPKAAAYYQTAVQTMAPEMEGYNDAAGRAAMLTKFMAPYQSVQKADQLLAMSHMSENDLDKYLEKEIAKEKAAIDEAEKESKELAALAAESTAPANAGANPFAQTPGQSGAWLFYNMATMETGRASFVKEWGSRPLEDNWRRSNKIVFNNPTGGDPNDPNAQGQADNTPKVDPAEAKYASVASKEDRLADIPRSPEQVEKIQDQLQQGLLTLGKTYYEELKDNDKAVASFKRLVTEFPQNENVPQALYLLQKICQEANKCDPKPYQQQLRDKYASSLYAKMMDNKDYVKELNANNEVVSKAYEESYLLYSQGKYPEATASLENLLKSYPDNGYLDKIELLRIMILVKTSRDTTMVENTLRSFISNYNSSELVQFAEVLLSNVQRMKGN